MQIELPAPTQEVSAQEQQIKKECIPSVAEEDPVILAIKEEQTEPRTSSVEAPVPPEYSSITDNHTQVELAAAQQIGFSGRSSPSFRAVPTYTKTKLHLAAHSHSFTCHICGRVTKTKSHMVYHIRTHTGEKPFNCTTCGKRYNMKSHLTAHIRIHTGERPYTCYICGKSFKRRHDMTTHAQLKHKENRPFKCMQCSQQFHLLVEFKQHMRTVHNMPIRLTVAGADAGSSANLFS